MIQKIIQGYKNLFSSTGKLFLLLLLCTLFAVAFVFPLWKFAMTYPKAYTFTILSILGLSLIFILIKKIRKSGIKIFAHLLLKFFTIIAGLTCIVILVFHGKRLFAVPVAIAVFFIYGLISFGFKKSTKSEQEND